MKFALISLINYLKRRITFRFFQLTDNKLVFIWVLLIFEVLIVGLIRIQIMIRSLSKVVEVKVRFKLTILIR